MDDNKRQGRSMAKNNKNKQESEGMKVVTSLTFNNDLDPDKNLMSLANAVGRLPKNRGIPLTSLCRNRLERVLEEELRIETQATREPVHNKQVEIIG